MLTLVRLRGFYFIFIGIVLYVSLLIVIGYPEAGCLKKKRKVSDNDKRGKRIVIFIYLLILILGLVVIGEV